MQHHIYSTDPQPPEPPQQPAYKIGPHSSLDWIAAICPHAQTMSAYASDLGTHVIVALPCRQWSCRPCAERRCKRLAIQCRAADPNRLLTLTVDPSLWETPRAAFDGTRRHIPTMFSRLRSRFGPIEYLRVTELTQKGWPHYHFLIRSGYLPHGPVKALWNKLTGATIIDIRQVDKHFRAYTYLLKYLLKLHQIEWTERHVAYSRNFFPEEPNEDYLPHILHSTAIYAERPDTHLRRLCLGYTIRPLSGTMFALEAPNTESTP